MILIFLHLWFLKFFIRKCIQRIVEKWSEFSPASVSNRWTPSFPLVKWGSKFNLSRFFQTVTWGGGLQWSIFWGLCLGKAVMVMVPFFFFFSYFLPCGYSPYWVHVYQCKTYCQEATQALHNKQQAFLQTASKIKIARGSEKAV